MSDLAARLRYLTDWLREQIAETRRLAEVDSQADLCGEGKTWHTLHCAWQFGEGITNECECDVKADLLAQCEAHSALLDLIEADVVDDEEAVVPRMMLASLALAYRRRPGYLDEWRPWASA